MIYENLAVCQRVGLISVVLARPNRPATPRVNGDFLEKHILCNNDFSAPATSPYAAWPGSAANTAAT